MPTVFLYRKAPVSADFGDCAGESAGGGEHGYNREKDGWELGKPMGVSSVSNGPTQLFLQD